MKKIVLSGGGTGGHFFPAIALSEEILNNQYDVHLITDYRCKEYYIAHNTNLIIHFINVKKMNNGLLNKMIFIYYIFLSTIKSFKILKKLQPALLISFGGYTSIPCLISSIILNIPIILHEQNCFFGKVNKFFARFATKIAISFPQTITTINNHNILNKTIFTGNIVRSNIRNYKYLDKKNNIFKILIFGGSQGARIFSYIIPLIVLEILKFDNKINIHITQQISTQDKSKLYNFYSAINISFALFEFSHNMHELYNTHNLAITRSGATTIAELISVGLPAIFIPYPYASNNHQYYNAKILEEIKASWCFKQNDIDIKLLAKLILKLIKNQNLLYNASKNLTKFSTNGHKNLFHLIQQLTND